jgi:hypothetical protein
MFMQSEQHRMRGVGSGSPLGCIHWRRVLLDESQRLGAGSSSGVCRAAAKLVAASRWFLSGEALPKLSQAVTVGHWHAWPTVDSKQ